MASSYAAQNKGQSSQISTSSQLAQVPALLLAGGHLQLAEQLYREALEKWKVDGGKPSTKAGIFLNNLAHIIGELGKVQEAENLYRRAISMWTETLEEGSEGLVATGLNNLAGLLKYRGELREAHELYEKALEMDEKLWGSSHPDVATDLNNFASLLKIEGSLDTSKQHFERAISIYEASFASKIGDTAGLIHPWLAVSLNNIGELCRYRGDLATAEVYLLRAVEIFENVGTITGFSGRDRSSSSLATSVHNLARCYHDQQRYGEAQSAYLRALSLWERRAKNSDSGDSGILSTPVATDAKISEGLHMDRSLSASTKDTGRIENMHSIRSNGLAYAAGLNNLGSLKLQLGEYNSAKQLYEQSISLRLELHGPEHMCNLIILNNRARLLKDQGDTTAALRLQRKIMDMSLRLKRDGYGSNITQSAICLNNYASSLQDNEYSRNRNTRRELASNEDDMDPMKYYRRSIELLEINIGNNESSAVLYTKNSLDLSTALNNLASLLAQRGLLLDARPLLRRSLNILDDVFRAINQRQQQLVADASNILSVVDHPRIANTRMNLIIVLWRLGDFKDALEIIDKTRHERQRVFENSSRKRDIRKGSYLSSTESSEAVVAGMLRMRIPFP